MTTYADVCHVATPPQEARKVRGKATFASDPYYGMKFILTDKAGKLALAAPAELVEEPILDAWLAREVRR